MIKRAAAITASVVMVLTVCLMSPTPGLADEPGFWIKTDGVNEITPALTKGTATFADDNARDFVHEIQWGNTTIGDEANWTAQADSNSNSTVEVIEVLNWTHENIGKASDLANYNVTEAWPNPEQTLNQGSGDSEDLAFLLASLLKWHTDEVNTVEGDLVYAECGFMLPPDGGFHAWSSGGMPPLLTGTNSTQPVAR